MRGEEDGLRGLGWGEREREDGGWHVSALPFTSPPHPFPIATPPPGIFSGEHITRFPGLFRTGKKEKMEKSRADRWSQFVRSHFLSSGKGKTFPFSTDIFPFYFYFPEVGDRIKLRRLNGAEKEMGKSSHYMRWCTKKKKKTFCFPS